MPSMHSLLCPANDHANEYRFRYRSRTLDRKAVCLALCSYRESLSVRTNRLSYWRRRKRGKLRYDISESRRRACSAIILDTKALANQQTKR